VTRPGGQPTTSAASLLLTEIEMGKYFIGWLLGIPAVVLVVLYFFFG
jgi:hypothetical protein